MTKRRDLIVAAALAGTIAAPAMADGHALPELNWRLATSVPPTIEFYEGAVTFAEEVERMTNGKFKIRVFAGGELVPAFGVFDAVSDGTVEMGHTASYYYFGKNEAYALDTTVPFGMNYRQFQAWWNYGNGKSLIQDLFAGANIVPFPAGNTGVQMGGWFNKEVKSVADLDGLKMRIGGMGGKIIEKLGVVPQSVPGADIYPSLEKGTIDAAEWIGPHDDMKLGFNKVAEYYYTPGWWEAGTNLSVYINKEKFDALPVEYQNIIEAAATRANVDMMASYDAKNPVALKQLIAGGTKLRAFPRDVLEAAYAAAQETYAELRESNPDFKRIYDDMVKFQKDQNLWAGVAEGRQDAFMQSISR